jgi:hypothetical protein
MRQIVGKIGVLWERGTMSVARLVRSAVEFARLDKVLLISGSVILLYSAVEVLTWVR